MASPRDVLSRSQASFAADSAEMRAGRPDDRACLSSLGLPSQKMPPLPRRSAPPARPLSPLPVVDIWRRAPAPSITEVPVSLSRGSSSRSVTTAAAPRPGATRTLTMPAGVPRPFRFTLFAKPFLVGAVALLTGVVAAGLAMHAPRGPVAAIPENATKVQVVSPRPAEPAAAAASPLEDQILATSPASLSSTSSTSSSTAATDTTAPSAPTTKPSETQAKAEPTTKAAKGVKATGATSPKPAAKAAIKTSSVTARAAGTPRHGSKATHSPKAGARTAAVAPSSKRKGH